MTATITTTIPLATEAPPLVEPTAGRFTQEQALDWLLANPQTNKTVREIAGIWGWPRSTTQRFVSRYGGTEPGTEVGQAPEVRGTEAGQDALSRETPDEAGFDYRRAECVLPLRTGVSAYIDENSGDLWISASDALRRCDTELRINAEDVVAFVDALVALVEPAHRGQLIEPKDLVS